MGPLPRTWVGLGFLLHSAAEPGSDGRIFIFFWLCYLNLKGENHPGKSETSGQPGGTDNPSEG
jgi:hypothetical protein